LNSIESTIGVLWPQVTNGWTALAEMTFIHGDLVRRLAKEKLVRMLTASSLRSTSMKKFLFSAAIPLLCLLFVLAGSRPTISAPRNAASQQVQADNAVTRDLVMLGPAAQGLKSAGFNPSGTVTVLPTESEVGTDKMTISVKGLPPKTDFTVFLHELSDIPFGSSQYIASMHSNKKGKASVEINTVIMEAFALKTAGDPPTMRLIDVDLKFVALWFADPQDSAPFVNLPVLAFDGDRSSGPVVLGTVQPLH
jgi:hypothetical protein